MKKKPISAYIIRVLSHRNRRQQTLRIILERLRQSNLHDVWTRFRRSNLHGMFARSTLHNLYMRSHDTGAIQLCYSYRIILLKQSALFCR